MNEYLSFKGAVRDPRKTSSIAKSNSQVIRKGCQILTVWDPDPKHQCLTALSYYFDVTYSCFSTRLCVSSRCRKNPLWDMAGFNVPQMSRCPNQYETIKATAQHERVNNAVKSQEKQRLGFSGGSYTISLTLAVLFFYIKTIDYISRRTSYALSECLLVLIRYFMKG